MEDETLSQEQIEALTKAVYSEGAKAGAEAGKGSGKGLSQEKLQAVKDTLIHALKTATVVLTEGIEAPTTMSVTEVVAASADSISKLIPAPYVVLGVEFEQGFTGRMDFIFSQGDAGALAQAVLKKAGKEPGEEFDTEQSDALAGLFNDMMKSTGEALTNVFGETVSFKPVEVTTDDGQGIAQRAENAAQAILSLEAEGLVKTQAVCLLPENLVIQLAGGEEEEGEEGGEEVIPGFDEESVDFGESISEIADEKGVVGRPAQFSALAPEAKAAEQQNIDLLLDVSLPIVIELGRTSMKIQDILELGPGSVVELDKLAGEPVDVIVNDKPIAKGEVVVVEENFGVRITNLISPMERIKNLR